MSGPEGLPTVAIVGRPNVGKSTLFNRLVRGRRALVDDTPGVTRDRIVAEADWTGTRFALVDTGGFEVESDPGLAVRIREHSLKAAADADAVIFLVDGRAGVAPADTEMARFLARIGKPVFCAVNKIDTARQEAAALEFYRLGLGDPLPISSEHGRRIDELLDRVTASLPRGTPPEARPALRIAIVGRPNVGKSSILNRLAGEDRMLVDSAAGTTRDAVDTRIEVGGQTYVLVDTAGIRRKSRIDAALERASVATAFRALERADVALLVIDGSEGVTDQDARLAHLARERGRGLVLVVNKWDTLPRAARDPAKMLETIRGRYAHLEHVPAVFVSALRCTHIDDLLPAARQVGDAFRTRIGTRVLNEVLGEAVAAVEPPIVKGKRARVYYATAIGASPPAIALFVNHPDHLSTAYLRYLENRIRAAIPLEGTPLRIALRARTRPSRPAPPRNGRVRRRNAR